MAETLTAEQLATDLVNLIRARMRETAINITVLDDVAAAIRSAESAAREQALAEAEALCRERAEEHGKVYEKIPDPFKGDVSYGDWESEAEACADAIRSLRQPAADARATGESERGGPRQIGPNAYNYR